MKKRFSEEQIIGFLREAEAGMAIKDLSPHVRVVVARIGFCSGAITRG
nr:hypothetical protein [Xanthomonas oryzae]